ncbi:hypothetical protein [Adlercreutzia sp. ZJ242]|nr:hypothetical protein [Adlercreutzia sp. ZJ242]
MKVDEINSILYKLVQLYNGDMKNFVDILAERFGRGEPILPEDALAVFPG